MRQFSDKCTVTSKRHAKGFVMGYQKELSNGYKQWHIRACSGSIREDFSRPPWIHPWRLREKLPVFHDPEKSSLIKPLPI
jgi:hypothetical protein